MSGRDHYSWGSYETKPRWTSYWHQIDEVVASAPSSCLIVGIGSSVTSDALKRLGIHTVNLDIEQVLSPDIVGDVCQLPFRDMAFDTVVCCQVLEHLRWAAAQSAVEELHRVAASRLVISLPQSGRPVGVSLQIPTGRRIARSLSVSARRSLPLGVHLWQVGSRGVGRKRVRNLVLGGKSSFHIQKEYVVPENAYHRFYVLDRSCIACK